MTRGKAILWIAVLVVAVVATALLVMPKAAPTASGIAAGQLRTLAGGGARIVDVRTPQEFASGHIEGAENVPADGIARAAIGWDKNIAVVIYDQDGTRSRISAQYLAAQGFAHVYDLGRGLTAWDGTLTAATAGTAPVAKGSTGTSAPAVPNGGPTPAAGADGAQVRVQSADGGGTNKNGSKPTMYDFASDT